MNAENTARSPRMPVFAGMQIKRRRAQSNKNPQQIKYYSSVISFWGKVVSLKPKTRSCRGKSCDSQLSTENIRRKDHGF